MRESNDRRLRAALIRASIPSTPITAAAAMAPVRSSLEDEKRIAIAIPTNSSPNAAVIQRPERFPVFVGVVTRVCSRPF
jgi:hypothetical protein